MKSLAFLLVALLATTCFAASKPNVVLIMCDDMGFSDIGCYGSEIETPHLDQLADQGVRFSQFKNTGRCCPSRASLMTGRHAHAVGMGWMTAVDEHRAGYRGQLSDDVPTLAEIYKSADYGTYICGKWHLIADGNFGNKKNPKPNGAWPIDRGFDEFYGSLSGPRNYFRPKFTVRNATPLHDFPEDYYYTDAVTEHAVKFIKEHDQTNPFFMYIAHYAPHRPLQAPEDRIDACRDRYRVGYDKLREERFQKLQELGIIDPEFKLPMHEKEFRSGRPSWESLDDNKKQKWITQMATYAAMIEIMDDGIGQVVETLKKQGVYDNTIILFLSDNGASAEGGLIPQLRADLSNTPYREYKQATYEGGISSPMIVRTPFLDHEHHGAVRHDVTHITDILPTCLELTDLGYPKTFRNVSISGPDGISMAPALEGNTLPKPDRFYEHQTSMAVMQGDWKLVREHVRKPWELIHLPDDPFEQIDLSAKQPEKASELETAWNRWADDNNVLPLEVRDWGTRIKYYKKINPDQDGID